MQHAQKQVPRRHLVSVLGRCTVDRQLQRWKTSESLDPGLSLPGQTLEWLTALLEPIRVARERLEALVRRAEALKGELESKAA